MQNVAFYHQSQVEKCVSCFIKTSGVSLKKKIFNAVLMNSFLMVDVYYYALVSVFVRYQSIPSIDNNEQEKQNKNLVSQRLKN